MSNLIVFYTWSGNTKKIAETIQGMSGGELLEIKPVNAYPQKYSACTNQAKKEIQSGFLPEIKSYPDELDGLENIFFGTPIWWGTMAPPLHTFLSRVDLAGKKIFPFCTHGGGGEGRLLRDIRTFCPDSDIAEELVLYGDGGRNLEAEFRDWIGHLGLA